MKVLGICCSPRLHGNTEILLREALKSAKEAGAEIELVTIADKTIKGCEGCESCAETKKCNIQDDMQDIFPKLLEADGIIFGVPVYFWTVNSQAKAIIDRTHCLRHGGLRNKIGGVVLVTGRVGHVNGFSVFANFFNIQRMILAGCAMAFGYKIGDVRNDTRGMGEAKALGKVVVKCAKRHCIYNSDTGVRIDE